MKGHCSLLLTLFHYTVRVDASVVCARGRVDAGVVWAAGCCRWWLTKDPPAAAQKTTSNSTPPQMPLMLMIVIDVVEKNKTGMRQVQHTAEDSDKQNNYLPGDDAASTRCFFWGLLPLVVSLLPAVLPAGIAVR